MALNTLESDNIIRQIAYLKDRIAKLESYFQGAPIPSVRIGKISADKITSGNIQAEQAISVVDSNSIVRAIMGDRGSGNYGLGIYDENGDVILDETKIKMQYTYSTAMESASVNWTAVVGFMTYCAIADSERNLVVRLDFVKPSNFVVTDAVIYYRMQDVLVYGATNRLVDVSILLNPKKTLVQPASDFDYYRYSGGNTITSNIDPNKDEFTGSQAFNSTQISAINDGQNYLIAQQETSSDTNAGFCVLTLVLTGYLEI